jgi:hypothetical protein
MDKAAPFHSTVRIWAGDKRLKTQHVKHNFYEYFKQIMKEVKARKAEKRRQKK